MGCRGFLSKSQVRYTLVLGTLQDRQGHHDYQLFMNFCCAPKLNSKMEGNLHSELGVRDAYVLAFFKTRVGWNLFR